MREGAVLLNFAREEIVDEHAVADALSAGRLRAYVCDFPGNALRAHPRVVMLAAHRASTLEAEENCAVMVADQVRAYLEEGTVHNSVNFPEVEMARSPGSYRLAVVNANVPKHARADLDDPCQRWAQHRRHAEQVPAGSWPSTLADVETPVPAKVVGEIAAIQGRARCAHLVGAARGWRE